MVQIGQLAVKTAGRDAGRECLVIDILKGNLVLIDGNTRRRKCSLKHLDLQASTAKIKKGANHDEIIKALETLGVEIYRKPSPKFQKAKEKQKPKESKKTKLFSKKKKSEPKESKVKKKTAVNKKPKKSKTEAKVKKEKAHKKK